MPLTKKGSTTLHDMMKGYGKKKGKAKSVKDTHKKGGSGTPHNYSSKY